MDGQGFVLEAPDLAPDVSDALDQESAEKKYRWMRFAVKETQEYLEKIRKLINNAEGFWAYTLLSHSQLKMYALSSSDKHALSFLTDIELKQDPKDPRPFELVFHFAENPYFSNSTLSKKYSLPEGSDPAPEDGSVTAQMREFDIDDLVVASEKIDWKSEDKNLCALQPRQQVQAEDLAGDDYDGDLGSFFWYFGESTDQSGIGVIIQDDILPDALDYFRGTAATVGEIGYEEEEEDELDEEDGLDDEEIDLEEDSEEEPEKKKRRV